MKTNLTHSLKHLPGNISNIIASYLKKVKTREIPCFANMPTTADLGTLITRCCCPSPRMCENPNNQFHSTKDMAIPQHNFIDSGPSSGSQFHSLSQSQLYTGLAKLEYLTYRIGHLSSFVSAIEETVAFSTEFSSSIIYFGGEVQLFCAVSPT